jgi:hypothetical protein
MCDARRTMQVPIKQGATGQSRERAGKGASNPFVKAGGKVESIPFMKVGNQDGSSLIRLTAAEEELLKVQRGLARVVVSDTEAPNLSVDLV